jgi:hypothetical protein
MNQLKIRLTFFLVLIFAGPVHAKDQAHVLFGRLLATRSGDSMILKVGDRVLVSDHYTSVRIREKKEVKVGTVLILEFKNRDKKCLYSHRIAVVFKSAADDVKISADFGNCSDSASFVITDSDVVAGYSTDPESEFECTFGDGSMSLVMKRGPGMPQESLE